LLEGVVLKGVIKSFQKLAKADKSVKRILKVAANGQGRRLYISNTYKNNKRTNFRVDQGGPVRGRPGTYNVFLQVNKETKNRACQHFIKKHGTHHVVSAENKNSAAIIDTLIQDALGNNFGVRNDEGKK
jgi:hypothetical protein